MTNETFDAQQADKHAESISDEDSEAGNLARAYLAMREALKNALLMTRDVLKHELEARLETENLRDIDRLRLPTNSLQKDIRALNERLTRDQHLRNQQPFPFNPFLKDPPSED